MENLCINRSGHKIKTQNNSSICEHINITGHNGSLEDFNIEHSN